MLHVNWTKEDARSVSNVVCFFLLHGHVCAVWAAYVSLPEWKRSTWICKCLFPVILFAWAILSIRSRLCWEREKMKCHLRFKFSPPCRLMLQDTVITTVPVMTLCLILVAAQSVFLWSRTGIEIINSYVECCMIPQWIDIMQCLCSQCFKYISTQKKSYQTNIYLRLFNLILYSYNKINDL